MRRFLNLAVLVTLSVGMAPSAYAIDGYMGVLWNLKRSNLEVPMSKDGDLQQFDSLELPGLGVDKITQEDDGSSSFTLKTKDRRDRAVFTRKSEPEADRSERKNIYVSVSEVAISEGLSFDYRFSHTENYSDYTVDKYWGIPVDVNYFQYHLVSSDGTKYILECFSGFNVNLLNRISCNRNLLEDMGIEVSR